MEDIKELCKRIIVISEGRIIYDGPLSDIIKKYAPYKELKITLNAQGVKKEQIEKYGKLDKFNPY